MTTKTNYRIITDAELLDEALDFDHDSIVYELAMRMSKLQIQNGYIDDSDYFAQFSECAECYDNEQAASLAQSELSELLDAVQEGDESDIKLLMHMHGRSN